MRIATVCAFSLMVLGCSGPAGVDDGGSGGGNGITGGGLGGGVAGGGSTGGGGATGGGATGGGTGTDAGFDAGIRFNFDAGAPCSFPTDCASGYCVDWFRDAGAICAATCFDQNGCSAFPNFFCNITRDGGTGLCVPRSPAHCLPCNFDSDCGSLSEACVTGPGETSLTCRVDCSLAGADACPSEYTCTPLMFNGQMRSFCLPPTPCPQAQAGFCDRYTVPQPCSNANDAGTCTGERACMNDRYQPCNARTPACKATCTAAGQMNCTEELCAGATTVPLHCGTCANACPGAGLTSAAVTCMGGSTCTFACNGERYDVDNNPDSGCEFTDSPTGNHTTGTAAGQGSLPCNDGSTLNATGALPSDRRTHIPAIGGFDTTKGYAPDVLSVNATGGTFCVNDIGITLTVTGATPANCFHLNIATDNGQHDCDTNTSGTCTITSGSSSYSGDTTIYLTVTRTCSGLSSVGARYTVAGHF
ncbi:MAG: hypothetical protein QM817_26795 [Archangium sp.]